MTAGMDTAVCTWRAGKSPHEWGERVREDEAAGVYSLTFGAGWRQYVVAERGETDLRLTDATFLRYPGLSPAL
jgi:hypothetical protein